MTTSTANGHHTTEISARSARTGTIKTWKVTWRTQRPQCCQHITPFDAESEPFVVDGTDGEPVERVRQCGGCGRIVAGRFNATRIR
jgi:hypothetical protein